MQWARLGKNGEKWKYHYFLAGILTLNVHSSVTGEHRSVNFSFKNNL